MTKYNYVIQFVKKGVIKWEEKNIEISLDATESIKLNQKDLKGNDFSIKMELPEEVKCRDGISTKSGTIVYDGDKEGVSVAVQGTEKKDGKNIVGLLK